MSQYGGHGGQKNSPWARGPQGGQPVDGQGILGFGGGQSGPMFQGGPHNVHPGLAGIAPLGHPAGVSLGGNQQFGRALNVGQLIQQQHPAVQAALQQHPQAQMAQPFGQNLEFRLPGMGQGSQPHQQQQGQQAGGQAQTHNPAHKVFTGTVTKLLENFGFVDEDVFFQTSVVKGPLPQVNDRVLVEAAYNANMPFKWNATRIQVMSNGRQGAGSGPTSQAQSHGHGLTSTTTLNTQVFNSSSMMSAKPSNHGAMGEPFSGAFGAGSRGLGGGGGGGGVNRQSNSPVRNLAGSGRSDKPSDRGGPRRPIGGGGGSSRDDRRVDRSRDRSRDRDRGGKGFSPATVPSRKRSRSPVRRSKSRSPRRGSVSPSKSKSPPRRRARTGLRYIVSIPKVFLNISESNILTLKQRYSHMYIPSDFFLANHSCNVSFPIHDPFKITQPSAFHVLSKEHVVNPTKNTAILDPPDADHTLNVKVMLLASPSFEDFISKTCFLAGESSSVRNGLVPPGKIIQFLVGTKGKNETAAIGGPWSPSLDGPNPLSNPAALIKTAIRTCKALTGIDLSNCTQWRKFLEVNYRRQESGSKPAKTETTVIFLPDVWSIMPTEAEYESTKEVYKKSMERKLNPTQASKKPEEPVDGEVQPTIKEVKDEPSDIISESGNDSKEAANADVKIETSDVKMESSEDTEMESDEVVTKKGEQTRNPTPWRDLDLKTIKVPELKEELLARGLDDKGLKSQLLARLQKSIRTEQEKEEQEALQLAVAEEEKQTDKPQEHEEEFDDYLTIDEHGTDILEEDEKLEPEKKQEEKKPEDRKIPPPPPPPLTDKQISAIKAAFKLPQQPTLLVHPNTKAKSGKFDCTVVSLSSMLDYRIDDNKEGTFEVSLFAELFNEMLIRDAGFRVYKAVVDNQNLIKEEKEKQEEKEKEKQMQLEKDKEKEKQAEKEKESADKEKDSTEKDNQVEKDKQTENEKEKDDAMEVEKSNQPSSVEKESKDKDNESSKPKKVEKSEKAKVEKKTVHKDLLSAFSFFDINHCGYVEAKDLEEILFAVGPTLSRAYIKKVVSKVTTTTATKETQVNYRAFTDLPVDAAESISDAKDVESLASLSEGFRAYLPNETKDTASKQDSEEGLVMYKGSVVDVGQLLAQLSRSEKIRADSERRLADTTKKLNELKDASEKLTVGKEKLQSELRDLKGRLKSTDEDRSKSKNDNKKYLATIKDIYGKIGALIADENEKEKHADEVATTNGTENDKN